MSSANLALVYGVSTATDPGSSLDLVINSVALEAGSTYKLTLVGTYPNEVRTSK